MEHLKYQETPQIDEIRKLDFIRFPLLNASYLIRTVGFFSIILIALFQIPDYLPENWELLSILGVVWWVSMFVYRILFKTNFIEIHERILSTLELLDTHKRKIHLNYDILFSYMRSDLTLTGINPEILLNIKNQIQTVTKSIEEYPRIFPDIGKLKWHLLIFYRPFRYLNLIRSLLFAEKKELGLLAKEFILVIQEWTKLHQKELLEVEEELDKQKQSTENLSGQGVIDLQRVRLHEHIETLNNITNIL